MIGIEKKRKEVGMIETDIDLSSSIRVSQVNHNPRYKKIPSLENTWKALLFLTMIFSFVFLADFLGKTIAPNSIKWTALLAIGFAINYLFMSMAILIHEAAHGLFAKTKWYNEFAGNFMGFFIFLPFNAYRHAHFVHHRILRDQGNDPEAGFHLEKSTYERLLIGGLRNSSLLTRNCIKTLRDRSSTKKAKQVASLDLSMRLGATLFWYFFISLAGLSFLHIVVPFLLMSGLVYSLRGTLDHHGLPAAKKVNGRLQLEHEKLSYITHTNRWMEFFWSNVNYHTVHHMHPTISWKYLKEIYEKTREEIKYTETSGYLRSMIRLLPKPYYSNDASEVNMGLKEKAMVSSSH